MRVLNSELKHSPYDIAERTQRRRWSERVPSGFSEIREKVQRKFAGRTSGSEGIIA